MNREFELDGLIQRDLDKYYDKNKKEMRADAKPELVRDVVRMIRYDVTFERRLLEDTLDYLQENYELELWQKDDGENFAELAMTEENFDAQTFKLRENFSHKRVEWLKDADKKLYGKQTEAATEKPKVEVRYSGESHRQGSQTRTQTTASHKQTEERMHQQQTRPPQSSSKGLLAAVGVVVIVIIAIMILIKN